MLTHEGNDLCLEAILILETASEITNSTMSITSHIRYFPDSVEHLATCEQKNANQTQACPDIAILNDRQYVWPDVVAYGGEEEDKDDRYYPRDIIDRSAHCGMRSVWEVTGKPFVHILGSLRSKGTYC